MAQLLTRMKAEGGRTPPSVLRGWVKGEIEMLRLKTYIDRLLSAFGGQTDIEPSASTAPLLVDLPPLGAAGVRVILPPLLEPLSQRELEVLRLLKTELSGPEIAQQLVIGLSTVRTYTKSIYSKLGVNSRRAAVKRATELNLI